MNDGCMLKCRRGELQSSHRLIFFMAHRYSLSWSTSVRPT